MHAPPSGSSTQRKTTHGRASPAQPAGPATHNTHTHTPSQRTHTRTARAHRARAHACGSHAYTHALSGARANIQTHAILFPPARVDYRRPVARRGRGGGRARVVRHQTRDDAASAGHHCRRRLRRRPGAAHVTTCPATSASSPCIDDGAPSSDPSTIASSAAWRRRGGCHRAPSGVRCRGRTPARICCCGAGADRLRRRRRRGRMIGAAGAAIGGSTWCVGSSAGAAVVVIVCGGRRGSGAARAIGGASTRAPPGGCCDDVGMKLPSGARWPTRTMDWLVCRRSPWKKYDGRRRRCAGANRWAAKYLFVAEVVAAVATNTTACMRTDLRTLQLLRHLDSAPHTAEVFMNHIIETLQTGHARHKKTSGPWLGLLAGARRPRGV